MLVGFRAAAMHQHMLPWLVSVAAVLLLAARGASQKLRPHLIVIAVEDVGLADISYSSLDTINLPHISRYSHEGTVLTSMYAAPWSHGSRIALHTGRHPALLGEQHEIYDAAQPYGVPPDVPLLSERLKQRGYACHAVGQWDLGFYNARLVPTARGFDTFYGSHLPFSSYKKHYGYDLTEHSEYDLHQNTSLDRNPPRQFKVDLYAEKARDVIARHNKAKPLFLYVALQTVRMRKMEEDCADVPEEYQPRGVHVDDKYRKCFFAYLAAADHAFHKILDALKSKAMLGDSAVLFVSLSSGAPSGERRNSGSNVPLRGQRGTLFEGGLRVPCFLLAPYVGRTRRSYDGPVHMTDWYHTLLSLADYDHSAGDESREASSAAIDDVAALSTGFDQLPCLLSSGSCRRRRSLLHYALDGTGSLQMGNYKLIVDTNGAMTTKHDEHYSAVAVSGVSHSAPYRISCERGGGRRHATGCGSERSSSSSSSSRRYYLFDVVTDPCETHDLAACPGSYRTELLRLQRLLNDTMATAIERHMASFVGAPPRAETVRSSNTGWRPWVSSAHRVAEGVSARQLAAKTAVAALAYALATRGRLFDTASAAAAGKR